MFESPQIKEFITDFLTEKLYHKLLLKGYDLPLHTLNFAKNQTACPDLKSYYTLYHDTFLSFFWHEHDHDLVFRMKSDRVSLRFDCTGNRDLFCSEIEKILINNLV